MSKYRVAMTLMAFAVPALLAAQAQAAPPIPLQFAPGSYGALAQGQVTKTEFQQSYTFDANAGQVLTITFAGAGAMRGQVQCQGGVGDGPYYGSGNSITVKTSGECIVTVGANTMAEQWTGGFTLAVLAYAPH
jgi:hypothetical protein